MLRTRVPRTLPRETKFGHHRLIFGELEHDSMMSLLDVEAVVHKIKRMIASLRSDVRYFVYVIPSLT